MFFPKASFNIFVSHEFVKMCFILVQSGPSSVFVMAYEFLIRLFHKLFNKAVENFRPRIRVLSF